MSSIPNTQIFRDFIADVKENLTLDSNRYQIEVILPPSLISAYSINKINNPIIGVQLRCSDIHIPGRSVSTLPYRQYGPARNIPYEQVYSSEIEISFILDRNMSQRKLFDNWMNLMTDRDSYKMGYYDSYVGDLRISMLDREGNTTYSINLLEVYPKIIGEIIVGNDKNDQFTTQDITLCYRKWTESIISMIISPNEANEFGDSTSKEQIEKIEDPPQSLWAEETKGRALEQQAKENIAKEEATKKARREEADRISGKYQMSKAEWNKKGVVKTVYDENMKPVQKYGYINRPMEIPLSDGTVGRYGTRDDFYTD